LATAALVASGLVVVGVVGGPAPAAAAPPACAPEAADEAAARAMARACQAPVRVLSLRSERREVVANIDGTMTSTSFLAVQRVRRAGAWAPVDTGLVRSGGSIVARAIDADVAFSAGGAGPLIVLRSGGSRVEISAPWPVPEPAIDGSTAVYAEVLPGVDLRLIAEPDGLSQLLVVKDRVAAQNPALERLRFPVSAIRATVRNTDVGGVEVVGADGATLFVSGTALMWDSSRVASGEADPETGQSGTENQHGVDAPLVRLGVVGVAASGSAVELTPDLDLLRGADVQYPVIIDPVFSEPAPAYWTHVNSCQPGTSFYTQFRSGMRVGTEWNTTCKWRTQMRFDVSEMHGATILGTPTFTVTADHVAACAGADYQLWHTDYVASPASFTWNSSQASGFYNSNLNEEHFEANEASCPDPDDPGEFSNVKATIQAGATANANTLNLALRAKFESDEYSWAFFHPNTASVNVTYDKPPNAPTAVAFSSTTDCYLYCSSPAVVRTSQPTFKVNVSDPYGGNLSTVFEVRTAASDSATLVAGNAASPASGTSQAQWPSTTALADGTYYWRARSKDTNNLTGDWSAWQTVTVDTVRPALPGVSSTSFPFKQWGAVAGTAGTFALAEGGGQVFPPAPHPVPKIANFMFSIDGGADTTVNGTTAPFCETTCYLTASVPHTPATDMVHTARVRARDAAGNISDPVDHQFWVSPVENRCWHWKLDASSGTTAVDTGNSDVNDPVCAPVGSSVTAMNGALSGSVSFTSPGYLGNGVTFTGSGGQIATTGPVLDTSKSFSVTAWVNASNLAAGDQTVVSQDGTSVSRFQLGYSAAANGGAGGWCLTMRESDSVSAATASACAPGDIVGLPTEDTWLHLAGVYDAATSEIRVYVMGGWEFCPAGETDIVASTGGWQAGGPLVIGRGLSGGSGTEYWRGGVDAVHAYSRALSSADICQLALQ
jgi:hypothetical protein